MADIGFALNYQHVTEVWDPVAAAWLWAGPGIRSIGGEKSESTSEDAYFDGGGNTTTSVSGLTRSYAVEGDRRYGDPFQDYVASLDDAIGDDLATKMRITGPDGECVERDVTVHNIVAKGPTGEANTKSAFSCTLSCNGLPRLVEAAKGTSLPDSVTAQPPASLKVGGAATVAPSVLPATASGRCLFAVEDPAVATVDADGKLRGVKAGKTRLAVKCAAKPSVSCMVEVTVTAS